ncbi:hypothetical protein PSQ40_04930 [Curvibacter sp. HBC61]|uniref:Uncharacterized protein n=1 Tax=Curvibacter cyanobacteriorum TaxID=3026422 RepID=A0ABT5MV48_9BURK|nr:hypothetical protein [Curvibacter sp. HBC61]MDD0837910.1 hypothetical protein [Curvibacter sp. HBC61]
MQVSEFIATFRAERQDLAQPYLWTDEEIVMYLNEAVNEACMRARLIEDTLTSAVCDINLTAGLATYTLHPSIQHVDRVTWRGIPLDETSLLMEDRKDLRWSTRLGQPKRYLTNGTNQITIIPAPDSTAVSDPVHLTVKRVPVTPLSAATPAGVPEIPLVYHPLIKDWVYRCAYLKQDADTFDEAKAAKFEAAFTDSFGARPNVNTQRKRRELRSNQVRPTW